jgi:hypothetical protein
VVSEDGQIDESLKKSDGESQSEIVVFAIVGNIQGCGLWSRAKEFGYTTENTRDPSSP